MLQYDDSAFYFFALSSLSCCLVPAWYNLISQIRLSFIGLRDEEIGAMSRTSVEKKKMEKLSQSSKGIQMLKGKSFIISVFFTITVTAAFAFILMSISSGGEVNSFDPFHILEIDSSADVKTIKKAYRTLSLQYHPDHCPAPWCEPKFVLINKAYKTLTDPVAKKCYEEFGNPDCTRNLDFGIGLPSCLLDIPNRNIVLVSYLIIIVGMIPFSAWRYYTKSSQLGDKDVMYDTYAWYYHNLNKHTLVKSIPEIIAGSAEFREQNMPHGADEKAEISKIMNSVRPRMQKPKYNHPVCVTGNVLMHAYLLRKIDNLSPKAREDLDYMLRCSNSLIEAMIAVCGHSASLQTAMNCIKFGQFVAQAMWVQDSPLLQLPHFTEEEAKHCNKGKASAKAKTITEYMEVPDDQKKGIADFSDDQKADVLKCCSLIPRLKVETRVFVDDDDDDKVYEGDLCTVKVWLTRTNLEEGEKASLIHSPRFPFPQREEWWLILGTREGRIISIEKVTKPDRVIEHDIKFLAPQQGDYEFDLHVMSNAYIGLDQTKKVQLKTLDASVLPEYKIHPDDAGLDDEPTLFEEMMRANIEDDSDSDGEGSDEEEEK